MLSRSIEQGDVDPVDGHKVDRLARGMEDHVAIPAASRRHAGLARFERAGLAGVPGS
jgi:hypothetical protein